MKIKVSDLKDEKLAERVARAQHKHVSIGNPSTSASGQPIVGGGVYRPDINSAQAMELVKKYKITLFAPRIIGADDWSSLPEGGIQMNGETPEIAICRAVVASVYGEYVDETNP